jgi:hypothetical protein
MIGVTKFQYDNTAHIFTEKCAWNVWDSYARSYRTLRDGPRGGRFPGTSCLATIVPSLRDISQKALEARLVGRVP